MIEYIVGIVVVFGAIILIPVLGISISAIVLWGCSKRGGLDWYRLHTISVDMVIDTAALLGSFLLGLEIISATVRSLLVPFLMLESGPETLLILGCTAMMTVLLLATVITGHRTRHYALESGVLEKDMGEE
ncbi:MAG: hypothetical protein EAX95_02060 [Candidatus Thorarchaeota archaeon]|nr:hypothetical protein [Candidatus Thorarchaeota archaeon]